MNVFLTGATGYVGQAVIRSLQASGHQVTGLVRNESGVEKLIQQNVTPIQGDLSDLQLLRTQSAQADATIHTAFQFAEDVATTDYNAVQAMLEGMKDSGKPFIYTSGAWIYGENQGKIVDETSPINIPLIYQFTGRATVEQLVLDYAQQGVRTIITRGGLAYGNNGGPLMLFLGQLQQGRVLRHVGTGHNRFPAVHINDFAQLYPLALEKAPAGSIYNVTDDSIMTFKDLFTLLAKANGSDVSVASWALEDARQLLAQFADAFTMDQVVSSEKAKRELGWSIREKSLFEELASGTYVV
jgi:nucleoside-diphosphate-sugar epimerase